MIFFALPLLLYLRTASAMLGATRVVFEPGNPTPNRYVEKNLNVVPWLTK